jgi:hypothetical protein
MAPIGIDPTKAGERETRGGAPAISDLLRTAIVVSLPMLSSAPAAATGFNLSPFTYQYIITNASGQIISPPASREPIDMTGRPIGQFKERYGTISGYYDVFADLGANMSTLILPMFPAPPAPALPLWAADRSD